VNLYSLSGADGSQLEVSADHYQQRGDHLLFISGGDVVLEIATDEVLGIVKVPIRSAPPPAAGPIGL
jgi:hypothetical protein